MTSPTVQPSAVSAFISEAGAKTETEALPYEVLHNLKYQHNWTDLKLHRISFSTTPTSSSTGHTIAQQQQSLLAKPNPVVLISGLPPKHSYIHPDFLAHLVLNDLKENSIPVQREWVLPSSIGEKWTVKRWCEIFDALPDRIPHQGANEFKHQDNKRVLLALLGHTGMGGDGTIVYYIMQEGDVKPRQN